MRHRGFLAKSQQVCIFGHQLQLFTCYLTDWSLRVVVNGRTSASYLMESSFPQGLILSRTFFFNDPLQSLRVTSAYADDCTLSHSYARGETANTTMATNQHLREILA